MARNYVCVSLRRVIGADQDEEGHRVPPLLLFFDDSIPSELTRVRMALGTTLKDVQRRKLQVRSCHVCRRVQGLELPEHGEEGR